MMDRFPRCYRCCHPHHLVFHPSPLLNPRNCPPAAQPPFHLVASIYFQECSPSLVSPVCCYLDRLWGLYLLFLFWWFIDSVARLIGSLFAWEILRNVHGVLLHLLTFRLWSFHLLTFRVLLMFTWIKRVFSTALRCMEKPIFATRHFLVTPMLCNTTVHIRLGDNIDGSFGGYKLIRAVIMLILDVSFDWIKCNVDQKHINWF